MFDQIEILHNYEDITAYGKLEFQAMKLVNWLQIPFLHW